MRTNFLLGLIATACLAGPAQAGLIQIDFTGVIDAVEDANGNVIYGGVNPGETVSGRLFYDETVGAALKSELFPGWIRYADESGATDWIDSFITAGGRNYSPNRSMADPGSDDSVSVFGNDADGYSLVVSDRLYGDQGRRSETSPLEYLSSSMIYLSGPSYPDRILERPELDDVAALVGALTFFSFSDWSFVGGTLVRNGEIRGYLTSITATPVSAVPVPGASLLYGAALAALGVAGRRRELQAAPL
jgi:hypothetical protein